MLPKTFCKYNALNFCEQDVLPSVAIPVLSENAVLGGVKRAEGSQEWERKERKAQLTPSRALWSDGVLS